jgi:hypothetical protein
MRADAKKSGEFVRYERVPQSATGYDTAGRLVTRTIYVKVPVGKLSVAFSNKPGQLLEQSRRDVGARGAGENRSAPFTVVY